MPPNYWVQYTLYTQLSHLCFMESSTWTCRRSCCSFLSGRSLLAIVTRSSAVAVIADRTAYNIRYSYRPLSGIAVVSMDIYLFTVSKPKSASGARQLFSSFVAKRYILQQKCLKKWIGSLRNTTVQLSTPTPTLSAAIHIVTDRQTDRQIDDSIVPIAIVYAVRSAKSTVDHVSVTTDISSSSRLLEISTFLKLFWINEQTEIALKLAAIFVHFFNSRTLINSRIRHNCSQ